MDTLIEELRDFLHSSSLTPAERAKATSILNLIEQVHDDSINELIQGEDW